jgi:hypothetical protein
MKLSFRQKIFLLVFLVNTCLINPGMSMHYVLARSIALDCTFAVGSGRYWDAVPFGGNWYPAIAPGLGFLEVPLVWLGEMIQEAFLDWRIIPERDLHVMFGNGGIGCALGMVTTTLFSGFAAVVFYDLLILLKVNSKIARRTTLLFMFSTFAWYLSVTRSQRMPAMALSLTAVYLLLRGVAEKRQHLIATAGLAVAASSVVEYVTGLFLFPLLFYTWKKRVNLLYLLVPALLGPVILGAYNYTCFGNPLTFGEQYYRYGSSPSLLSRFNTPLYIGLFGLLFSPAHGLVFYAPVVFYGLFGVKAFYREWKKEVILFLSFILIILCFYGSWDDWEGGMSLGPCFLTVALPYFVLPIAFLDAQREYLKWGFSVTACVGFLVNMMLITVGLGVRSGTLWEWAPFQLWPLFLTGKFKFLLYRILWYLWPW